MKKMWHIRWRGQGDDDFVMGCGCLMFIAIILGVAWVLNNNAGKNNIPTATVGTQVPAETAIVQTMTALAPTKTSTATVTVIPSLTPYSQDYLATEVSKRVRALTPTSTQDLR